jgi:hypothetical protein
MFAPVAALLKKFQVRVPKVDEPTVERLLLEFMEELVVKYIEAEVELLEAHAEKKVAGEPTVAP